MSGDDPDTHLLSNIELEAQLLNQEHRVFWILWNAFWRSRKLDIGDPRRRAAWMALLWNLIPNPTSATGGGLLTAAVTILAAAGTIWFAFKTDQKLGIQNQQQRAARVTQHFAQLFGPMMFEVDRELAAASSDSESFKLTPSLATRIRALSELCQPYRDVNEDGDLEERPLSPERRTLIVSLAARQIDFGSISHIDLSYADLRSSHLPGIKLDGAKLNEADFSYTWLNSASFRGADLGSAVFVGADLIGADLSGADLRGAVFSTAVLEGANLAGAMLESTKLADAQDVNASLEGAFVANPQWLDELATEPPDDFVREEWKLVHLDRTNEIEAMAIELDMRYKIVRRLAK